MIIKNQLGGMGEGKERPATCSSFDIERSEGFVARECRANPNGQTANLVLKLAKEIEEARNQNIK